MPRKLLDLAFLIWTIAWVALAVQVAAEVRGLRDLSTTVRRTGEAVRESGRALEQLGDVPVVGSELTEPADRVQQAGESAIQSGRSSRASIRNLSILLAVVIGVLPPVALLGTFLHLRQRGTNESRAVGQSHPVRRAGS